MLSLWREGFLFFLLNVYWLEGLSVLQTMAIALQSRVSEVLQVDMHPAAQLGRGIMIDHATGVVIGETAIVGDNVSLLHHTTLGGSGTGTGKRHPTIGKPHPLATAKQAVSFALFCFLCVGDMDDRNDYEFGVYQIWWPCAWKVSAIEGCRSRKFSSTNIPRPTLHLH